MDQIVAMRARRAVVVWLLALALMAGSLWLMVHLEPRGGELGAVEGTLLRTI